MAVPVVSWWNKPNSAQVTSWPIGTVDAGTISADFSVLVWNNRGGATAVSDMQNCTVTTKDNLGGNTGELVTNKWIEVRVDSAGESGFSQIGGTTTRPVKGGGSAPAGTISGVANDGTYANAKANFAELTLHANVPTNASAGAVNFLTRISYQYT